MIRSMIILLGMMLALSASPLPAKAQSNVPPAPDTTQLLQHLEGLVDQVAMTKLEKQQQEIERHHQVMKRMTITNFVLGGAFLVTCLLLWVSWYHIRTTQKKNQFIATHIYHLLAGKKKKNVTPKQTVITAHPIDPAPEIPAVLPPAPAVSEKGEKKAEVREANVEKVEKVEKEKKEEKDESIDTLLFQRIERVILEEKLYLNPNLNRQDILERFSINKNQFGRIMQKNLQMTFPEYLNGLRIKHAMALMSEQPQFTTQAVAEESGFNNLRNFQRNFKIITGMTTSEFRKSITPP